MLDSPDDNIYPKLIQQPLRLASIDDKQSYLQ